MRKKWAKVALVSLVLGTAINVAVAWVLVVAIGFPRWQGAGRGTFGIGAPDRWSQRVPAAWPPTPQGTSESRWWCCTIRHEHAEWPAPIIGPDGLRTPEGMEVMRTAKVLTLQMSEWGWPMRSLRTSRTNEVGAALSIRMLPPPGDHSLAEGIRLPPSLARSPFVAHLPLMPVWPGFAINTLLYAAVAAALLAGPGKLRRALRRRRGQCTRCGYDLAGLAQCPECGHVDTAAKAKL